MKIGSIRVSKHTTTPDGFQQFNFGIYALTGCET